MTYKILHGSNLDILPALPDNSVDSIVTDPPYELGFMGKSWDSSGIAYSTELWGECLRVLKPGGHLLAFSGSRTYHRMVVAIEDSGFEIRDMISWISNKTFPKSHNIEKATQSDKWKGWGTALKPTVEPIAMARKPLIGTVAENVLTHGTGGLNIDGSRIGFRNKEDKDTVQGAIWKASQNTSLGKLHDDGEILSGADSTPDLGRWPSNVILDPYTAELLDEQSGDRPSGGGNKNSSNRAGLFGNLGAGNGQGIGGDSGGASRFFYVAKASKRDRNEGLEELDKTKAGAVYNERPSGGLNAHLHGEDSKPQKNFHPTVKPTDLMRYLIKLVTPPGGVVLDPFTGSGSTGKAAILEGFDFIGIELTEEYLPIIEGRLAHAEQQVAEAKAKEDEALF